MAGEIYIARQDTLENVQSTVNEIDANVDTANNTLGNFAGGGTDSVVTELNALKEAVAALTTKTDGLQTDITNIKTDVGTIETTIAGMGGQSGNMWSALPVKTVVSDSYSLTTNTTYYIWACNRQTPNADSNSEPIINCDNTYLYIYDSQVARSNGQSNYFIPLNTVLKIKFTNYRNGATAVLAANDGLIFILDI